MIRLAIALVLVASTASAHEEITTHELKVKSGAALTLENDGGSVEILPGASGSIKVEAHRRAETRDAALALPVTVQLDGNIVRVRYHEEHHVDGHSVAFVITAPPATSLQLSTGGGSISTRQMGIQSLHSGGGAITALDSDGTVEAKTGGGSVHVAGRLRGENKIATGGGSVHVAIPADSRLKIEGTTGGGSAQNDFGIPVEGRGSHHISGTIGDGKDGSLQLRTGGGSIQLSRL